MNSSVFWINQTSKREKIIKASLIFVVDKISYFYCVDEISYKKKVYMYMVKYNNNNCYQFKNRIYVFNKFYSKQKDY